MHTTYTHPPVSLSHPWIAYGTKCSPLPCKRLLSCSCHKALSSLILLLLYPLWGHLLDLSSTWEVCHNLMFLSYVPKDPFWWSHAHRSISFCGSSFNSLGLSSSSGNRRHLVTFIKGGSSLASTEMLVVREEPERPWDGSEHLSALPCIISSPECPALYNQCSITEQPESPPLFRSPSTSISKKHLPGASWTPCSSTPNHPQLLSELLPQK